MWQVSMDDVMDVIGNELGIALLAKCAIELGESRESPWKEASSAFSSTLESPFAAHAHAV